MQSPLDNLLTHFSLRAGVFYTGNICGLHDFERDERRGLIKSGPVQLIEPGKATVIIESLPAPVLSAIQQGQPIPDEKLAVLYALTQELVRTNGGSSQQKVAAFLNAGYKEKDIFYIVLAVAVKVLSNYTNHAFGTEVDERFSVYKIA